MRQSASLGVTVRRYVRRSLRTITHCSGRDIVFSLSNKAPLRDAAKFMQLVHCQRFILG